MSVYTVYSPHAVYRLIRLIFPIFSSRVSTTCIAMSCHRQEFPPENCNETQKILSHGHPSELICVDTSEMILVVLWKFTVTIRAGQIIYISLKCSPQYTFPGEKRFRFFFFPPYKTFTLTSLAKNCCDCRKHVDVPYTFTVSSPNDCINSILFVDVDGKGCFERRISRVSNLTKRIPWFPIRFEI